MKQKTIKITVTYDMSGFQEDIISPKEKVKEIIIKNMIEEFGWDDGYSGIEVDVVDT